MLIGSLCGCFLIMNGLLFLLNDEEYVFWWMLLKKGVLYVLFNLVEKL